MRGALIALLAVAAGCGKDTASPGPADEPAAPVKPPAAAPSKPDPDSRPRTPWGEDPPPGHPHPADTWITVFDLGGIFDLSVRGLPAVGPDGKIALASSTTVGDGDTSALSVEVVDPASGAREVVVIVDPAKDGDRLSIGAARERAALANAMLSRAPWRRMLELESVGTITAGAEQKLASVDGAATASFKEPALELSIGGERLTVDGKAWSRKACAGDASEVGNVLLSGVWVDVASGAVVARIGYEGPPGCANDPIFAIARVR